MQLLSYTNNGELRKEDNCAEVNDDGKKDLIVYMNKCHGNGDNQKWNHEKVCNINCEFYLDFINLT